jgi:SpoVK/Ycf46/Vps4 family AAA+-type ATPase
MSLHQDAQHELDCQICSNRPLIYVCTYEEQRVVDAIREVCTSRSDSKNWNLVSWDLGAQLNVIAGDIALPNSGVPDQLSVLQWFNELDSTQTYTVLILKDFHKLMGADGHPGQAEYRVIRLLRNMVQSMIGEYKCIVIMAPALFLPKELERTCAVIDWPLPEEEDIKDKVTNLLSAASEKPEISSRFKTKYTNEGMQESVHAFKGLTLEQIQLLSTYLMLTTDELNATNISSHKRDAIRKSTALEWIPTNENMDAIGGMKGIKEWLNRRKEAFGDEARQYGLPYPKGALLVGIQGCGKSSLAKAVATTFKQPLLRLDFGRLYNSLLGSTEENVRNAIKIAESIAPCVLWADELEKGVSGASHGISDGGTSSRVFATFLTWMQEKTAPVFLVATANDVSQLPPEMLRKGRFDEIFFVDLPDVNEREEIFKIHLRRAGVSLEDLDKSTLLGNTEGFTGAEIEAVIIEAMHDAFLDNQRKVQTNDLLLAVSETVPLSQTMSERITALRNWAQTRARAANSVRNTKSRGKIQSAPIVIMDEDDDL